MKLKVDQRSVEVTGFASEQRSFGIKSSRMMFKILSNNLYSDKILAVLREYGCNAYDSHIIAGCPEKPFEVHLPNNFEPFFYIRDFGTGLSEEDIYNVYTQYGESTKSERNDQVGALGLGSKSAFAYVDQFTIESWHGGKHMIFNAFMDKNGEPQVIKMTEYDSDEPNGVKVQLMAEASDTSAFAERARKIFHRFPVLPIITGNKAADLTQVKYTLIGPNYKLREQASHERYSYGEHSACFAVQGTVAYPIKRSNFNGKLTPKQEQLLQYMPLDIEFPIGELDIAPSREELSYDKSTQENILKALDKVISHVPDLAIKILDAAATEWEAKLLYEQWIGNSSSQAKFMREMLDGKLIWKGNKVTDNDIRVVTYDKVAAAAADAAEFDDIGSSYDPTERANNLILKHQIHKYGDCAFYSDRVIRALNSGSKRNKTPSYHTDIKIEVNDKTRVLLVDDEKKGRRLPTYIKHNYGNDVSVYVFRVPVADHQKIIDQLGGCPIVQLLSELDEPPITAKDPTVKKKSDIRQCYKVTNFVDYGYPPMGIQDTTYDVSEGGIYVMMYSKNIVHPGQEFVDDGVVPNTGGKINDMLRTAYKLGLLPCEKIYAFNSSRAKFLQKDDNWVSIYDYLKVKIKELLDNKDLMFNLTTHREFMEQSILYKEFINNEKVLREMDFKKGDKSRFIKLLDSVTEVARKVEAHAWQGNPDKNKSTNYNPDILNFIVSSTEYLGANAYDPKKGKAFVKKFEEEMNKYYPLLVDLFNQCDIDDTRYYRDEKDRDLNKKKIAHYINLCEASPLLAASALTN